jgi:hypothetical protein
MDGSNIQQFIHRGGRKQTFRQRIGNAFNRAYERMRGRGKTVTADEKSDPSKHDAGDLFQTNLGKYVKSEF